MRTTVRLPQALLERAKRKAAAEGRTLTALIEEGLSVVLAGKPVKQALSRRRLPRVSKATGGLLPGIDPVKINTHLEEIDDLDKTHLLTARK